MKLDKLQFHHIMKKMLCAYNQSTKDEIMREKFEAYFEKLKWQETHIVEKVINAWDGAKLPNAAEILAKCKGYKTKSDAGTPLLPHEKICRYMEYGHSDECEISRYFCSNQSDNWEIDAAQVSFCLSHRPDKKIICYWHMQVIRCQMAKAREAVGGQPPTLAETWADRMIDEARNSPIMMKKIQEHRFNGQNNSYKFKQGMDQSSNDSLPRYDLCMAKND